MLSALFLCFLHTPFFRIPASSTLPQAAVGRLGERPLAAKELVRLLADERFGVFAQRSIASLLGALGEQSVASELVQLLSDERLHVFVRTRIADALGLLAEDSVAAELAQLLSDERLEVDLRRSIAHALAAYVHDTSVVEGLVKLLQDEKISDSVYSALWAISKRGGINIS